MYVIDSKDKSNDTRIKLSWEPQLLVRDDYIIKYAKIDTMLWNLCPLQHIICYLHYNFISKLR